MNLPDCVLACPATLALIIRAKITGELPNSDYDAAWDALEAPAAYQPTDEVQTWVRENWHGPIFGAEPQGAPVTVGVGVLVPGIVEGQNTPIYPLSHTHARSWMSTFLRAFVETGGNATAAAKAAGVHERTPYKAREVDKAFAEAWQWAERQIGDVARMVLWDRAVNGVQEPVYGSVGNYMDGLIGTITKYDNSLLKYLVGARCEEFKGVKEGGTTVNVTASAHAEAKAELSASPEMLAKLQKRNRKQMEKKLERANRQQLGKN